mmetsp:Transcript_10558/g.21847  ORF Transcript_10558/g.21847 Transcript_10558/m.21847 type:complete len:90 (-) Transcript_10558:185-454(-)
MRAGSAALMTATKTVDCAGLKDIPPPCKTNVQHGFSVPSPTLKIMCAIEELFDSFLQELDVQHRANEKVLTRTQTLFALTRYAKPAIDS